MKKRILSIVALAALVALPMSVFAQVVGTTTTNSEVVGKARIVIPITMVYDEASPLDFGIITHTGSESFTITADATAATRVFTPDGDDAAILSTGTYAKFTVGGAVGLTYNVGLPTAAVSLGSATTNTVGTVSISDFSHSPLSAIPSTGSNIFYVGGILNASDNAAGSFQATFPVTVTYN